MMATADPYTRLVTYLKIILPLAALAILSTLFLISSRVGPGTTIPFAEHEVAKRIETQQVTTPFFAGVTSAGDDITMTATEMVTFSNTHTEARDMTVELDFLGGGRVVLVANQGDVDMNDNLANLTGDVVIQSTSGYTLTSDYMTGSLTHLDLLSPGAVQGTGPGGTLNAGSMHLTRNDDDQMAQLLFTGGVKLVYDPKANK